MKKNIYWLIAPSVVLLLLALTFSALAYQKAKENSLGIRTEESGLNKENISGSNYAVTDSDVSGIRCSSNNSCDLGTASVKFGNAYITTSTITALASSTNMVVNGTLGINTNTPIASLGLVGVAGTNPVEIASSTGSSLLRILQNGQIGAGNGTAALPTWTFTGDPDNGMWLGGTNILGFSTAGSQRLTVDASGNVGIASSTPTALLTMQTSALANASRLFRISSSSVDYILMTGEDANGIVTTTLRGPTNSYLDTEILASGMLMLPEDGGLVDLVDLPVSSGASNGTVEGYSFLLDGLPVATVYGTSDGAGQATSTRFGVNTTTPSFILTSVIPLNSLDNPFGVQNNAGNTLFSVANNGNIKEGRANVNTVKYIGTGDGCMALSFTVSTTFPTAAATSTANCN